jgi:hypothetical protein
MGAGRLTLPDVIRVATIVGDLLRGGQVGGLPRNPGLRPALQLHTGKCFDLYSIQTS